MDLLLNLEPQECVAGGKLADFGNRSAMGQTRQQEQGQDAAGGVPPAPGLRKSGRVEPHLMLGIAATA